ncbi:MAG: Flp pilus assembly protein CpaB [Myxococcota bacterium]|jgi:pilus assembly protein CpaB|nr:Flp pilus assembly protein CpaB [Myxococcota bacterium]
MKSFRVVVVLVLSAVAAAANVYVLARQEEQRSGGELVSVVAVGRKIAAGHVVASSDLAQRQVPRAYLDERAVPIQDESEVVGALASVDLRPGQVVLWSDLGRESTQAASLAQKLPSGQRAMTIRVDRSLSLAGLLQPGHRVDILCTLLPSNRGVSTAITALQNVLVLATGVKTEIGSSSAAASFDTVTLSVGVTEAQKLALASATGKLSLILRGHDDLGIQSDLPETAVEDLRGFDSGRPTALGHRGAGARIIERLVSR